MQSLMDAGSQRNVYEIIPRNCAHLTFYEGDEMTDLTLVDVRLCVKIGQGDPGCGKLQEPTKLEAESA